MDLLAQLKHRRVFVLTLLCGFLLRLYFSQFLEHRIDRVAWRGWGWGVNAYGLSTFYSKMWCDYMPAYPIVLGWLHQMGEFLPAALNPILYKLPANLADLALALLIFDTLKKITTLSAAKISALAYFFNPAVILNSVFWGQVDSLQALMMSGSLLMACKGSTLTASAVTGLSFMFKPQGIVLAPIIGYFTLKTGSLKKNIGVLLIFMVTAALITLPYLWSASTLLTFPLDALHLIRERFAKAYEQYPYSSVYAFNIWSVIQGHFKSDQELFLKLTYQTWGMLFFGVQYLLLAAAFIARKYRIDRCAEVFRAASLLMIGLFFFATRGHERGFFPALAFLSFIFLLYPRYWLYYVFFSLFHLFNMIFAYLKMNPLYGYQGEGLEPYAMGAALAAFSVFLFMEGSYFYETIKGRA